MNWNWVSQIVFRMGVLAIVLAYGMYAAAWNKFPYRQLNSWDSAWLALEFVRNLGKQPWYFHTQKVDAGVRIVSADEMMPGLTVVSTLTGEKDFHIKVIDPDGSIVADWRFDIFSVWPDFSHLEDLDRPKQLPGSHVHGVHVMPDGGVVFVIERIGLVRMNACGDVQWRLPMRAHHSVFRTEEGDFWVPGQHTRKTLDGLPPNHQPPVDEMTLMRVSKDGELLDEVSVFDLLRDNGLHGLLYLSTTENFGTSVTGDTLHLNDIEVFPSSVPSGVFRPGDVMISLRNLNGVFVFDPETWKLRAYTVGRVLRQHDPDFLDGNRVAIFDNNTLVDRSGPVYSRVALWDARTGAVDTLWQGSLNTPFYTSIMGKQQHLANGNILLVEAMKGRVIEVGADGDLVWEWFNVVGEDLLGIVDDAQRLPVEMDAAFFNSARDGCAQ